MTAILCCACHKNEPPVEVRINIAEQYIPATLTFDKQDTQTLEKCRELYLKHFVVRSADEFPDDPLGFSAAYSNINFKDYDLLVFYYMRPAPCITYSNRYFRNTVENSYNWHLSIGIDDSDYDYETGTTRYFTRFAIEVRKIPENAEVKVQYSESITSIDWWTDSESSEN